MKIEFLYFEGCPNHQKAYELLQQILREKNIDTVVERIEIKDDEDATRHKFVGSPTIRIDGTDVDVSSSNPPYGRTCRLYRVEEKLSAIPSRVMIESAVRSAANRSI